MEKSQEELLSPSSFIWVQCEEKSCLKWRKLHRNDSVDFSVLSWFCSMNPDKNYDRCSVPQEKESIDRSRFIYVASELEVGSLIWGKMVGYPSWPGIITPDPLCSKRLFDHVIRYTDGTNLPRYYHVEFLGKPATHAWLQAYHVEVYSEKDLKDIEMKYKNRKSVFSKLEAAVVEANAIIDLSNLERLNKIVFKVDESFRLGSIKEPKNKVFTNVKSGEQIVQKRKYLGDDTRLNSNCRKNTKKDLMKTNRKWTKKPSTKRNFPVVKSRSLPIISENMTFPSENSFRNKFNSFCLERNLKKEERKIHWYKKELNLYRFYQIVQYMGGYKKVAKDPMVWKQLCQEVTNTKSDSEFLSLKKAYRDILLEFENIQSLTISCNKRGKSSLNSKKIDLFPTMHEKVNFNTNKPNISNSFDVMFSPVVLSNDQVSDLNQIVPDVNSFSFSKKISHADCSLDGLSPHNAVESSLPSSNQETPVLSNVLPADVSIFDIGLDVAMEELDNLSNQLRGLTDQSQNLFVSSSDTLDDSDSFLTNYQPINNDFADVLGELTDVEDTLVEVASDILGVPSNLFP